MTYQGKVTNGVVVLEKGIQLPEGTSVTIVPAKESKTSSADDAIYRLAELAAPTGITDLATNIDHYLYGHPKVTDAVQ